MTVKTKMAATVVSAGLVAGAIYAFEGKDQHDPDDRKVVLVASTDNGHALVQYSVDSGTHHDEFGSSYGKKKWEPASWSVTLWVKSGTPIVLIVTADEVTGAHCAIRGPGVPARPPGVSPNTTTNTVECTGTVK